LSIMSVSLILSLKDTVRYNVRLVSVKIVE